MKRKAKNTCIWVILILLGLGMKAEAGVKVRAAGIGFRGTYWRANSSGSQFRVVSDPSSSSVDVGGGGGWLYFFSRVDNDWIFEFSLGAVGKTRVKESTFTGKKVDVDAIISVLFGLRHELISIYNPSALRPYLQFGAGPYWLSDVTVRTQYDLEEDVWVHSHVKAGGYAGGGMNFMFTSWLGFNFDAKYHFVDFNVNHPYSGWEYGAGIFLTWGRFHPSERYAR